MVPRPLMGTFPDAVMMNDHQGETWAEIVGAANVVDKRIAATGGGTEVVSAASFAGMPLHFHYRKPMARPGSRTDC